MRVSKDKFFSMLEKGKISNFSYNGVKYYALMKDKFIEHKMNKDDKQNFLKVLDIITKLIKNGKMEEFVELTMEKGSTDISSADERNLDKKDYLREFTKSISNISNNRIKIDITLFPNKIEFICQPNKELDIKLSFDGKGIWDMGYNKLDVEIDINKDVKDKTVIYHTSCYYANKQIKKNDIYINKFLYDILVQHTSELKFK